MKRILFGGVAFLLLFAMSCSMLDDDYVAYYAEIGNIRGESINNFVIETDSYNILTPIGELPNTIDFKDGARVLVQFSIEKEDVENKKYNVRLTSIENLFEKNLVKVGQEGADTLKKDAMRIVGAWMGKDYLNIEFSFRGSGSSSHPHYFDLVFDSTKQNVDKHIALDLTHNANDDPFGTYNYKVLMSVSLEELKVADKDSISLWLRANDELYKPQTIGYKYNIDK